VRNHLPVPAVDAAAHRLAVEGEGLRRLSLSVDELKARYRAHTVVATVQCSGNRRSEMKAAREGIKGLDWGIGAIGTAAWTGVLLADVLADAGLAAGAEGRVRHVQFEGLDADMAGQAYGASIPVHKATDPQARAQPACLLLPGGGGGGRRRRAAAARSGGRLCTPRPSPSLSPRLAGNLISLPKPPSRLHCRRARRRARCCWRGR
jgi:hypothetical protein